MRTNYVLIDFESVQPESLAALEHDHFKVYVFVGASQAKVPFEVAAAMQRMGTNAEYVKIAGHGKNALDFHIAFYIGQLATTDPTGFFHIISKDTGFDPLIQHLKEKKIFSARSPSIEDIPLVKSGNQKQPLAKPEDEKARLYLEMLRKPKSTKPRTDKTLAKSIASFFQKQVTEAEIGAITARMQKLGHIKVADGKVTYTLNPKGSE